MSDKPVRVAQMMTEMNFGGVEMVVMNYYRNIDRSKVQFDFFALEGSSLPMEDEIRKLGGGLYIVPKYTNLKNYEKEIQRLFRENNYKIVHSHMNTLSVFSLYGAKKAGVPIRIAHNHSTAGKGETKKNIMKYILRPFSKLYPTELCACSRFAGEWIYGKKTKFKVINNAIDLDKYKYNPQVREEIRKELGLEDKFVIGHVGRFCYQKNHELLINIFAEVLKQLPNAVLMLIGEGELEQDARKQVKDKGIEENVLFLGKKKDAYKYYQAMDSFLLPSRYEGLGMVAIEAQASGLPVVCSKNVPIEAKILDNVVFVDSIDDYCRAVLSFCGLDRRDNSAELRKAGFDIKVEATKLIKYYEELLK